MRHRLVLRSDFLSCGAEQDFVDVDASGWLMAKATARANESAGIAAAA
jgi:hypothetical protein